MEKKFMKPVTKTFYITTLPATTLLLWANFALGDVIIKAPSSSLPEYLAYVKTTSRAQTLANHQDRELRKEARTQRDSLIQTFQSAQREFLSGDLKTALKLFQDVASTRHQVHWPPEERFVIHYSLLRAAQLSSTEQGRHHWLQKAIEFDWTEDPDPVVFPPPLIESYKSWKENLAFVELRPWILWPKAHGLLINGRRFAVSPGEVIQVPKAENLLLSILSHSHLPLSTQSSTRELRQVKFDTKALAEGSCSQPHWPLSQRDYPIFSSVYFNSECVVTNPKPAVIGIASSPHFEKALRRKTNFSHLPAQPEMPSAKSSSTTWLWLGAAVIGSSILLHNYRSELSGSRDSGLSQSAPPPPSLPRIPSGPTPPPDVTFGF